MNDANEILIIKALDGLAARQVATAENIANASTPNYRPLRVSFESALKAAAASGEDAVRQMTFRAAPAAAGTADAKLRLDLELATASTTATRYEALIDIFDRQMEMDSIAARGGD